MSAMSPLETAVMELRDRGIGAPRIALRLGVKVSSVNRIISIYGSDALAELREREAMMARGSLELLRRIEALRGIA